ncbi:MAG: DUF202 domain-containing protein [Ferrovum sp.]|jgi:putative membrane protein|nr:DUF202 domain-containing protein [Ferrovum sp.]NDU90950.1 DUF202 domain-containing protein [Ferrovum sp.]
MSDLNDPRVFFAAERTLLSWNRTSLTLMGFGFMIERFGLFMRLLVVQHVPVRPVSASHWVGIAFILLGSLTALVAIVQYRKVLITLKPVEVPKGYAVNTGVYLNALIAVMGLVLSFAVPEN